jgi:hypothetical protein
MPTTPRTPLPADVTEAVDYRPAADAVPAGDLVEPLTRLLIERWRRRKTEQQAGNGEAED